QQVILQYFTTQQTVFYTATISDNVLVYRGYPLAHSGTSIHNQKWLMAYFLLIKNIYTSRRVQKMGEQW
ncbi:hypothetical protein V7S82_24130, partial [Enterobacter hormaechei subsp. steigerwaltii]|uniref:hypothetical protein n=1 Tax=Enterobacter hormaechei TaxID=158836 RepID=UPI0032046244